jgi:acyl-CoA thioesterase FadM
VSRRLPCAAEPSGVDVKWSECDSTGVVYTVTFSDYILSAAELFYGYLFETKPHRAKTRLNYGTPNRALSIDFRASLWPDDEFEMTVRVKEIRTHTYLLQIDAVTKVATSVFSAVPTVICIARGERQAIRSLPRLERSCRTKPSNATVHLRDGSSLKGN